MKMRKPQILQDKPTYLDLSILDLNKTVMYECWFDYKKPKYHEKARLLYMDTNSFIVYVKADDIYKDITENVETKFDNSNYDLNRSLPKGKN